MSNGPFSQLLDRQKYLPGMIGFMVGIIHFAFTYRLMHSTDLYVTPAFFMAPGLILSYSINPLRFGPAAINLFHSEAFFIGFSSFFYGMMVGLLVSTSRSKRWLGIILLGLLIFSGCYLMMLAFMMMS